ATRPPAAAPDRGPASSRCRRPWAPSAWLVWRRRARRRAGRCRDGALRRL
ncbi:MAG: hypothetical protein AVDCRST_MAG52-1033, partial [uncultured Blastococcus sp.]